jgi:hypothetical protein
MRYTFAGSPASLEHSLRGFLKLTRADELMLNVHVFDQIARCHSLALMAGIRDRIANTTAPL